MPDNRKFKGRSPLLMWLAGTMASDVVPNINPGEGLAPDFVGPPTADQAVAGKLNADKPFKAGNILAKPAANQANLNYMIGNMQGDMQANRQVDVATRVAKMQQELEDTGFPAQLARTLAQDKALREQGLAFQQQELETMTPLRLKARGQEKDQDIEKRVAELQAIGGPQALNTYQNTLATNLIDPRTFEQFSARVNAPTIDQRELQARAGALGANTDLREAERKDIQHIKNSDLMSGLEDIGLRTKFKQAQFGEQQLPQVQDNQAYMDKNFVKFTNEDRARNKIVPSGDYFNFITGQQVLTKPKTAADLLAERALGIGTADEGTGTDDPSTAPKQGYASDTIQTKPELVKPAPAAADFDFAIVNGQVIKVPKQKPLSLQLQPTPLNIPTYYHQNLINR